MVMLHINSVYSVPNITEIGQHLQPTVTPLLNNRRSKFYSRHAQPMLMVTGNMAELSDLLHNSDIWQKLVVKWSDLWPADQRLVKLKWFLACLFLSERQFISYNSCVVFFCNILCESNVSTIVVALLYTSLQLHTCYYYLASFSYVL